MSEAPRTPRTPPRPAPVAPPPAPVAPPPAPDLGAPDRWWLAQSRRLAAQLLLSLPEHAGLRAIAGELASLPPDRLAARLSAEATALQTALTVRDAHPLGRAARAFQLSPFEIDLLALAMLPELDDRFGDAFSAIRGGPRRPTLGLAIRLLVGVETDRLQLWAWLHRRSPWRFGLLIPGEAGVPMADRELIPTPALCAGALGLAPATLSGGATVRLDATPDVAITRLRPSLAALADELRAWNTAVGAGALLVPGDPALGRELAEALAGRLGCALLRVGPVQDARAVLEATALSWMLGAALSLELPRELAHLSLPEPWVPPLCTMLLAVGPTQVDAPEAVPLRKVSPPIPGPAEQAELWSTLVRSAGGAFNTDLLGNQTRLPLVSMRAAVQLARSQGALTSAGLAAALAQVCPDPASPLATVTRPRVPWDSVILPAKAAAVLEDLRARLEHRATVHDRWGLRGPEGRGDGLIALLHGEPGTGKTLVAEAIATALGLPLLRIDLSRVVSKYIGETEKNLASAFDGAEGFRAVLFFDEADALFSRRTSVSDAHDRYANLETNYLLQRLEAFEGLALLATNALQNLDEAFLRRIPFIIALPRPTRANQRQLWAKYLPESLRAAELDLDRLAQTYDLVGGEIRSAAIGAAYAAAVRGGPITPDLLDAAVRAELQKRGRPLPERGRATG